MFQDMNISPYKVMFNSKHAQWVEIIYGAVFWVFFLFNCKVTSSNTSRLEAHAGFFRLLMKGIFDPYVL